MAKVSPFHSTNPNLSDKVYHDNDECTEGNNIEEEYLALGKDNRTRCSHCDDLDE